MSKPDILHLIVNPHGGKGKSLEIAKNTQVELEKADIQVVLHPTQYFGHSEKIITDLDLNESMAICGVGGDGTAHHLINGLLKREDKKLVPIGILPAGTGNDLAFDLGISNPQQVIDCIKLGKTRPLDVGHVKGKEKDCYMAVITTWGYTTLLTITAEKMRWFGMSRYTIAGLLELMRHKGYQGKVILDDGKEVIKDHFDLFMVLNTRYSGKRMLTVPSGSSQDGLLDLVMLRNKGKSGLYKTLMDIQKNTIKKNTIVEYRQFKTLTLEPQTEFNINIDGELFDKAPCSISVAAQNLMVFA